MLKRRKNFEEWVAHYQKAIDRTNAKILEALQLYGPRNVKALAESSGIPDTTVRFRIEKLIDQGLLLTAANLDFAKLGLARGFLITDSLYGRQDLLREVIHRTDYWNYIARCYGKFDGFIAYFAFPAKHKKELQEYLKEAAKLKAFSHYLFFWITNTYFPHVGFEWYDFEKKQWKFRWNDWVDKILNSSDEMPEILKEPSDYTVLVDERDLLILKELQKDATQDFRKLAKVVGITPQSLQFRWQNHILKRKLILQYTTDFKPYPFATSDVCSFIVEFNDEKSLAKFCNASNRKPFIVSYGKIIGKDSLVLGINIPKREFPKLIEALNLLYTKRIVKKILYVMLDIASHERQTVSYEFFKDGEWTYDHKRKLEELRGLVKK